MGAASEVGGFLLKNLAFLFALVVLIRVMLQVARADFYNPVSQAIVKISNPLLLPLRRIIPSIGGLDTAGVVLAYAVVLLTIFGLVALDGRAVPNIANVFAWAALGLLSMVLTIYWWAVLISIILSLVAMATGQHSHHPLVLLLHQFTEPVLAPFRRILPDMGGLDLSPILLFLAIGAIRILVFNAANAVQLLPGYVLGF